MSGKHRVSVPRRAMIVAVSGLLLAIGLMPARPAAEAQVQAPEHSIILPSFQYMGNSTCSGGGCHSGAPKKQFDQMIGDELTIWRTKDPHRLAYESLEGKVATRIMEKLKLPGPAAGEVRCLGCHAMHVPNAQRGEKFQIKDSVGCESCHGPAEKWIQPHQAAGWTGQQRKATGAQGLRGVGLIDTSDPATRAQTCVACHLQIDWDMIEAGHPALDFELSSFSEYVWDERYKIHWDDSQHGPLFRARLWASGQAAGHEAATAQIEHWKEKGWGTGDAEALATVFGEGLKVALALPDAKLTARDCACAAADLARAAAGAKTELQAGILIDGVRALVISAIEGGGAEPPESFWSAYENAWKAAETLGDGAHPDAAASVVAALKEMAAAVVPAPPCAAQAAASPAPPAKVPDAKVRDAKLPDPKLPDPKLPDPKLTDPKVTDPKVTDPKLTDAKVPDAKVPDSTGLPYYFPGAFGMPMGRRP